MRSTLVMDLVVGLAGGMAALIAPPVHAATHDPCALVTQAEVSSAVGGNVGAAQPIGTKGCQWSTDDVDARRGKTTVTLTVAEARAFPTTPLPGVAMTPVGGIGDEAVFTSVGPLTTLAVRKGSATLVVRVYGVHEEPRQRAIEKTLVTDVLARW